MTTIDRLIGSAARQSRVFFRNVRGVAGIEAAFIFPVMLLIYFGLLDLTSVLSANRRVTQMASTLADLVTQSTGTTSKAELAGFYRASTAIMDPYSTNDLALEVFAYRRNGNGVVLAWHDNNGRSCGAAPEANTDLMKKLTDDGNDVIAARVCYEVAPLTGRFLRDGKVNLSDQMTLRSRQSNRLNCADC
jgi:Flp pilus assembly protein TadG